MNEGIRVSYDRFRKFSPSQNNDRIRSLNETLFPFLGRLSCESRIESRTGIPRVLYNHLPVRFAHTVDSNTGGVVSIYACYLVASTDTLPA